MIRAYRELLYAINRAYKEYADFARSVGVKSAIGKEEFMMMFMDYHKGLLERSDLEDGESDHQKCQ